MRFADIGQQLRAYRLESGLRAEEIAARLGVSRAALYRYEKGEVIKLDTIRRLAELLKISPLSLLGIGVEYFSRPLALQERLRQVEEDAEQILQLGGSLCTLVTTDAYDAALTDALTEAADQAPERLAFHAAAEQTLGLLHARKRAYQSRRPSIIAMVSEQALRSFLIDGVAPALRISERTRQRCRSAARAELENIASLMDSVPMGLQIGLLTDSEPTGAFVVLRARDRAHLCANPFMPDSPPLGAIGVGTITAADEAVTIHQRVAETAWREARKGAEAAARVRLLLAETRVH
ncbi:helix-turn-helix transcriptional regulator [Roseomonas sp. SSH11]|uniref:Helix-turn-helix transcriptional regulator n=1 Tax=Pararoseomonas baculiformis TaxID=2820812 RepID=A0ABS4AKB5_9PROT|nr:helix-turn-helix transcriptional regulator [Pararoseomonas baculiformis]MBP0447487.1 helix-turn-helix transcriptional regulator [Pararoseomonas baculiformis]